MVAGTLRRGGGRSCRAIARAVDPRRDAKRRGSWPDNCPGAARFMREPNRPDYARSTDQRATRMPFGADERHWHYASCNFTRGTHSRDFWFDRAAPHRTARRSAYCSTTASRMQPVLLAQMADRFWLHESRQRPGRHGIWLVDLGNAAASPAATQDNCKG